MISTTHISVDIAVISKKIRAIGTWNWRRHAIQGKWVVIYNEDTEEWKEAQTMYQRLRGNSERQIGLIIGFGNLRAKLSDCGESRIIMQKSQESRQGDINRNLPTILRGEENGGKNRRFRRKATQIWKIGSLFRNGNLKHRMVKKRNKTNV